LIKTKRRLSVQSENAGVVNGINQKQYLNAAKNSFVRMNILKPGTLEDDKTFIQNKFVLDHECIMVLLDRITGYNEEAIKPVLRSKTYKLSEKNYKHVVEKLKDLYDELELQQIADNDPEAISVHLDMKFFIFEDSDKN